MAKKRGVAEQINNNNDALRFLAKELTSASSKVTVLNYVPHSKQKIFHKSDRDIRLYIGGNRSGKTLGSVIEGIYWSRKQHPYQKIPINPYEPVRGRVCGVDFLNGIDKIILPQYAASVPKSMLINGAWTDSYNAHDRVLTFNDDSFIEFMSYDQDLDKFAGTSRHWVHMDEEPPKTIYTENYARIVDTDGRMWISMTPVEGMTWVFDTLYEPGITGDAEDVKVIIVDMTENPHLTDEARRKFILAMDEEDIEARVHGRFIQMGGLIYKKFDPDIGGTHIIDVREKAALKPPKNWEVLISLDHGFNNPAAVLWSMISPEGEVITYRELYERGKTVKEMAGMILAECHRQNRMPDQWIADPSIVQRNAASGTSIQQEYSKYNLYWALGNNDVKSGLSRVQGYMNPYQGADEQMTAMWQITSDCENTIKEAKKYRWKTYKNKADQFDNNAYEEPHKKDDHAMDSLRYALMSRPDLLGEVEKELPNKKGELVVPSSVTGWDDFAKDFHSLSDVQEIEPHEHVRGQSNTVFDEHMGDIW